MSWHKDLPVAFTLEEAARAGVSRHRLNRAQRSGSLWRPARGLYVDLAALRELTAPDRHRALARAAPRLVADSALSHASAALLLGLPHPPGALGQVRLTVEHKPKVNRPSDWVHLHRAGLPAEHVTGIGGVPVTTAARTVLDCCRELRARDALAIADAALRSDLCSARELGAMFRFQHRWPGASGSRHVLPLADPRRENWFESASAALLHAEGVPLAIPQVEVSSSSGDFLGRVDFLWLAAGVIGEADGAGKLLGDFDEGEDARGPQAVARRVIAMGERSARFREAGFEVVHWTPTELMHDAWSVARRYFDAARRADPRRISARLRCGCCRQELESCRWAHQIVLPQPSTLYAAGAGKR